MPWVRLFVQPICFRNAASSAAFSEAIAQSITGPSEAFPVDGFTLRSLLDAARVSRRSFLEKTNEKRKEMGSQNPVDGNRLHRVARFGSAHAYEAFHGPDADGQDYRHHAAGLSLSAQQLVRFEPSTSRAG